ncbi:MAG: hypothetical protein ABI240_07255 [Sphingomonas sp.]
MLPHTGTPWCWAWHGMVCGNVALNPAVTRVTVVERDADVIALIGELGIFEQLPAEARAKIDVVRADAFDWMPDTCVDSLQADISAKVVEPTKLDDVRRLQDRICAGSLYFWGQEMELWRLACRAAGHLPPALRRGELDDLVAQTGLPLVMPTDPDLPAKIVVGARWWTPQRDGGWE